jgi:septum formation protein
MISHYNPSVQGPRLILASTSPRRRALLAQAGLSFEAIDPGVEDADLTRASSSSVAQWACSLSYLKALGGARWVREQHRLPSHQAPSPAPAVILGADTLVELDAQPLSKPTSEQDARAMISAMAGRAHDVVTGVSIIHVPLPARSTGQTPPNDPASPARGPGGVVTAREIFFDRATVHLGPLTSAQLDAHISSGAWIGKAGGYNLAEQLALGWPLRVEGDPDCVVGLPLRRLTPRLTRFIDTTSQHPASGAPRTSGAPGVPSTA